MNKYRINTLNTGIWDKNNFIGFLSKNQKGDIYITNAGEGGCMQSVGLYNLLDLFEFNSVTIETGNALETHHKYNVKISPQGFRFFKVDHGYCYKQYHQWNLEKIFGAFYNRPLWHRLGLASYLHSKYHDKTMLNFRHNPHDVDQKQLFELKELFEFHTESLKNFVSVLDQLPITLEQQDGYTKGASTVQHTEQLAAFYKNFFVDIVAETFTVGQCFFATEKTVRPMLLKKPMVVMASKNHLAYLRQMGFRTFADFWDEDYDGYDGAERYLRILKLIDNISKKSKGELEKMYWDMQYTLDHNYELLLNKQYNKKVQRIE